MLDREPRLPPAFDRFTAIITDRWNLSSCVCPDACLSRVVRLFRLLLQNDSDLRRVYDAETRSQIATDQGKAALRTLFELKDKLTEKTLDLYFGPTAPTGHDGQWIKTIPGKGWFVYFRVYGPEQSAFDGAWKPGDFEEVQ